MLAMVTNWVDRRPSILQPAQPAASIRPREGSMESLYRRNWRRGFCATLRLRAPRKNRAAESGGSLFRGRPFAVPSIRRDTQTAFQKFHRGNIRLPPQLSICRICRLILDPRRRTCISAPLTRSRDASSLTLYGVNSFLCVPEMP